MDGELRGELGLLSELGVGEVGRLMLVPAPRRKYALGPDTLTTGLIAGLNWWRLQIHGVAPNFAPLPSGRV